MGFDMDMDMDMDMDLALAGGGGKVSGRGVRPVGIAVKWPPEQAGDPNNFDPKTLRMPVTKFPRQYWDPWRYAFVTIAEFSKTRWEKKISVSRPSKTRRETDIQTLIALSNSTAAKRRLMMPEIIAQAGDASRYWQAMLMFNSGSHPATFQLMTMAFHVGRFLAMNYKVKFNVPRPSQVSPAILPWLDPPAHASFPSGHALEGRLMSHVLADVVPEAEKALMALSKRVGENREIAGLHYSSDTLGGFDIARQAFPLLKSCASYKKTRKAAKKEWKKLK